MTCNSVEINCPYYPFGLCQGTILKLRDMSRKTALIMTYDHDLLLSTRAVAYYLAFWRDENNPPWEMKKRKYAVSFQLELASTPRRTFVWHPKRNHGYPAGNKKSYTDRHIKIAPYWTIILGEAQTFEQSRCSTNMFTWTEENICLSWRHPGEK